MKKYLNLDKKGDILSLINTNDPTLQMLDLFEVNEDDYNKVYKDIKEYKVKNKKLVKVDKIK